MNQPVIGIDFGPMSVVSVAADAADQPGIIAGSSGAVCTPAVIYFGDDGRTLVGEEAIEPACEDPGRAVLGVRDWLGDPAWKRRVNGAKFRAADLAGILFERVAKNLGAAAGACAVMAIPAYFNDEQRRAAMEGARGAGLGIVRLLSQPTSAALAYACTSGLSGTVLVYNLDMEFDATVLRVDSPTAVEVLATDGDYKGVGEPIAERVRLSEAPVLRALKHAGLEAGAIDAVVLSGSMALDHSVDGLVERLFGRAPRREIHPAEVVARGAAIHASVLAQDTRSAAA